MREFYPRILFGRTLMFTSRCGFLALLLSALAFGQAADHDKVWREFMDWAKAQTGSPFAFDQYKAKLVEGGLTAAQADERIALVPKLYESNTAYRAELQGLRFDRLYRDPKQTRFMLEPNAFLVETVKKLKPGKALDVAMGQGRNAVFLATIGWDVTGYDVAEEGLKVANENAAKAGVRITTVKATFDGFDYGKDKWDLIYFVYTDAPTADPKFVERICAALKPGGLVLLDRPYRSVTNPEPGWKDNAEDKVNAHTKAWSGLQIVFYEDTTGIADWQQTANDRLKQEHRIVRLLARKL